MFFKKKKIISSKPSHPKKTAYLLALFWAIGICFLGVFVVSAMNNLDFKVFDFTQENTDTSLKDNSPITVTPEDKISYILLTGRWGGNHDAPDLTDTIILVGINTQNESITLFSIPRDLYVNYPDIDQTGKINRIYETFLPQSSTLAIEKLKTKVSEITGKNIDYYMNIDFNWFREVVDALWGVEITLENNFVDYKFPDGNLWYRPFILRKWTWTLDGDVALMYARSRHSTSDFDRSLRQQQIISSLRDKVGSLWYFKDSKKILSLYNIFKEYVETDMSLTDMVSLGLEIKWWEQTNTLSFNLNDTCYDGSPICEKWGLLYVPLRELFWWASVLLPENATIGNLSEYDEIQKYSSLIFEKSSIYTDPKNIVIYNNTGIPLYAWTLANILRPYGFSIDPNSWTQTLKEKKFEKSILYYNGINSDDSTLIALQKFLDIEIEETQEPLYSENETRIEIILADQDSF